MGIHMFNERPYTGGGGSLSQLSDVDLTNVSENDQLINKSGAWINKQLRAEKTQAEYNALVEQGLVDPDVEYLISDGQLASAPIDDNDVSPNKTWSSEKIESHSRFIKKETVSGTTTANGNLPLNNWSVLNWIPIYADVVGIDDTIATIYHYSTKTVSYGVYGVHITTSLANPTALVNSQVTVDVYFIDKHLYLQS